MNETADLPTAPPPDPDTRTPKLKAPPGTCDTHCHVFGPAAKYGFAPVRRYTPPDCLLADYLRMARTIGVERTVLVNASGHGTDNRPTLDAIAEAGTNFRGVAIVDADVTEAELTRLHEGGMRGLRMNTLGSSGGVSIEHMETLAERTADLGWLVELHLRGGDELLGIIPRLRRLKCNFVIDHFGGTRGGQGAGHPAFRALLDLMRDSDLGWVKLASFYRLSDDGSQDWADMVALARALIEARPDRLIWGSNWPHPNHHKKMPNDGDLLDAMAEWTADEDIRRQILADNPARLFGFE